MTSWVREGLSLGNLRRLYLGKHTLANMFDNWQEQESSPGLPKCCLDKWFTWICHACHSRLGSSTHSFHIRSDHPALVQTYLNKGPQLLGELWTHEFLKTDWQPWRCCRGAPNFGNMVGHSTSDADPDTASAATYNPGKNNLLETHGLNT